MRDENGRFVPGVSGNRNRGPSKLTREVRENALAAEAARLTMEAVKASDFADVFALFNTDPNDDPLGAGTAPGSDFEVFGLDPVDGDADGMVGEVVFPTVMVGPTLELRENISDISLGMPRDINGDEVTDNSDHSADYALLPVVVRLRWEGNAGERQIEVKTLLSE